MTSFPWKSCWDPLVEAAMGMLWLGLVRWKEQESTVEV